MDVDGLWSWLRELPTESQQWAGALLEEELGLEADILEKLQESTMGAADALNDQHQSQVPKDVLDNLAERIAWEKRKGNSGQVLNLMERSLQHRISIFGSGSSEVSRAIDELCTAYNRAAMQLLPTEHSDQTLVLLRRAFHLTLMQTEELFESRIQTLNNLACCHRKMGYPRIAERLLQESLKQCLQRKHRGAEVALVNLAAVLSQCGRHQEAYEKALQASQSIQRELVSANFRSKMESPNFNEELTERIVLLGLAYHSVAVEKEFLGNLFHARSWYKRAYTLACRHLSNKDAITKNFRKSLKSCQNKLKNVRLERAKEHQKTKDKLRIKYHRQNW